MTFYLATTDDEGRVIGVMSTNHATDDHLAKMIACPEDIYHAVVHERRSFVFDGESFVEDIEASRDSHLGHLQRLADRAANAPLPPTESARMKQALLWSEAQLYRAHGTVGIFLKREAKDADINRVVERIMAEVHAYDSHLDRVNAVQSSARVKLKAAKTIDEMKEIIDDLVWPTA